MVPGGRWLADRSRRCERGRAIRTWRRDRGVQTYDGTRKLVDRGREPNRSSPRVSAICPPVSPTRPTSDLPVPLAIESRRARGPLRNHTLCGLPSSVLHPDTHERGMTHGDGSISSCLIAAPGRARYFFGASGFVGVRSRFCSMSSSATFFSSALGLQLDDLAAELVAVLGELLEALGRAACAARAAAGSSLDRLEVLRASRSRADRARSRVRVLPSISVSIRPISWRSLTIGSSFLRSRRSRAALREDALEQRERARVPDRRAWCATASARRPSSFASTRLRGELDRDQVRVGRGPRCPAGRGASS